MKTRVARNVWFNSKRTIHTRVQFNSKGKMRPVEYRLMGVPGGESLPGTTLIVDEPLSRQERFQQLLKQKRFLALSAAALTIIVLILVFAMVSPDADTVSEPEPRGCTPDNISFDYFELVLQWPPSFGTTLGDKVDHWTIHGLWPSRIQHPQTYPCDCTKEPFRQEELSSILPKMKQYWPSFKSSDYASFWSHEWEKHGTCCRPYIKTQLEYFSTPLGLRDSIDPGLMLQHLKPSAEKGYTFAEIYNELAVGGDVGLSCNRRSGRQVLTEVNFCVTAGTKPVRFSCPKVAIDGGSSHCDPYSPIFIPPASQTSKPKGR